MKDLNANTGDETYNQVCDLADKLKQNIGSNILGFQFFRTQENKCMLMLISILKKSNSSNVKLANKHLYV